MAGIWVCTTTPSGPAPASPVDGGRLPRQVIEFGGHLGDDLGVALVVGSGIGSWRMVRPCRPWPRVTAANDGGQDLTSPTAVVLIVFGRGVRCVDGRYTLTPGSTARVRAAVDYVAAHEDAFARAAGCGQPPRIVFTGGWAEASEGAAAPPAGCREGDLMLHQAHAAALDRYAELHAETRSRSTLENLLHTVEAGLLAGRAFSTRQPLGIVSHTWHLPRIRFLAGKVLGLRGAALLDVPVSGGELAGRWPSERAVHLASRLCYVGVRDGAGLLHRERRIVASVRRAERLVRRRPA